jgi:oligopeptide transport system substrate-binding protein
MKKSVKYLLFALVVGSMLLSACAGGAAPAAEGGEAAPAASGDEAAAYDGPKVLNATLGHGDIPTLDPSKAQDTSSIQMDILMFPGVTRPNEETSVVENVMADSFDLSDDGTVYTFNLKKDVYWVKYDEVAGEVVQVLDEEGNPRVVTADDFYYGFIRTLKAETASPYAYVLGMTLAGAEEFNYAEPEERDETTVGVKVIDANTLELTFINPGVFNAAIAGMWMGYAQPSWLIEEVGDRWFEPGIIQTYGPYTLKDWIHDYEATLVKNPFWVGTEFSPEPAIDEVNFRFLDEPEALAEYEAGNVDWSNVPGEDMDRVKADPVLSAEYFQGTEFCSYYYGFNTSLEPVDDARVRRALSMAIDRQGLIDAVLKGAQQPSRWVANPGLAGAPTLETHPDAGIGTDLEAAKAELQSYLDEKGVAAADLDLTLLFNDTTGHKNIAEAIQAMWKDTLGVEVKLAAQEWKVYLETTDGPDAPQIFRLGWCQDYPDANNFTKELFGKCGNSNTCDSDGNLYGGLQYFNQDYEDLLNQAALETDNAKRQDLYAAAADIIYGTDAAVAPIYWYGIQSVTKPYVTRTYGVGGQEYYDKWDIDMAAKMAQ